MGFLAEAVWVPMWQDRIFGRFMDALSHRARELKQDKNHLKSPGLLLILFIGIGVFLATRPYAWAFRWGRGLRNV